jgi:hypothetical protein
MPFPAAAAVVAGVARVAPMIMRAAPTISRVGSFVQGVTDSKAVSGATNAINAYRMVTHHTPTDDYNSPAPGANTGGMY